jgi:TolB protein
VRRHGVAVSCVLAAIGACAGAAEAAFPGVNGSIVFARSHGPFVQIYVAGRSGRHARQITHAQADSFAPASSADGERIAFVRTPDIANPDGWDVAVMDSDGRHVRRLQRGRDPRFSANGRKIAFTCDRAVCTMNADGTSIRRLASDGQQPDWSADGRRIVFKRPYGIWVMDADGSHQRRLTRSPEIHNPVDNFPGHTYFDWAPRFSPDGDRIVFVRQPGATAAGSGEVYVMDANGEHARALTQPGPTYDAATFSPDGRKILFWGGVIYVMRADGTHQRRLVKGLSADWQPLHAERW